MLIRLVFSKSKIGLVLCQIKFKRRFQNGLENQKRSEDQVLVIQRKARKFGVSREEYLRRVIQEKAEEDELRVQEKYHKEVLDRLIDTLIENNHLMDKVATHFGIEIDQRNTTKKMIF